MVSSTTYCKFPKPPLARSLSASQDSRACELGLHCKKSCPRGPRDGGPIAANLFNCMQSVLKSQGSKALQGNRFTKTRHQMISARHGRLMPSPASSLTCFPDIWSGIDMVLLCPCRSICSSGTRRESRLKA